MKVDEGVSADLNILEITDDGGCQEIVEENLEGSQGSDKAVITEGVFQQNAGSSGEISIKLSMVHSI